MRKIYDYSKLIENLLPSQEAIQYLQRNYNPISYTDFTGYAVDLGRMFPHLCDQKQFCLLVSWDGEIAIIQFAEAKKALRKRKIKRFIKELKNTQFLVPKILQEDPFEEFASKFEIPIDLESVIIVEEALLKYKVKKK